MLICIARTNEPDTSAFTANRTGRKDFLVAGSNPRETFYFLALVSWSGDGPPNGIFPIYSLSSREDNYYREIFYRFISIFYLCESINISQGISFGCERRRSAARILSFLGNCFVLRGGERFPKITDHAAVYLAETHWESVYIRNNVYSMWISIQSNSVSAKT